MSTNHEHSADQMRDYWTDLAKASTDYATANDELEKVTTAARAARRHRDLLLEHGTTQLKQTVTKVARVAGISRNEFYRALSRLDQEEIQ